METIDVKQFHNDLKAALIAGAPIEIGDDSRGFAGRLSLARIGDLQDSICRRIPNENSSKNDSESFNKPGALNQAIVSEPGLPTRYRAALQVFDQTGSMVPVLDGLTARSLAQKQVSRVLRRAFLYLVVLLAVAFWGLTLFQRKILPLVDDLRADISLAAGTVPPARFDEMLILTIIIGLIGCGLVLMVVWLLLGGASKVAMCLGGRHYVRCRVSRSAIRTLQLLLSAGLPVDDAVSVSVDLTGADAQVRRDVQVAAESPHKATQFKTLADYFKISAEQRLANMKVAAPTVLICTVGGVVTLAYCLVLFLPIITILKELTVAI